MGAIFLLDSSLCHCNDKIQRHYSSLNKCSNFWPRSLRINKNQNEVSLTHEKSKQTQLIIELERHFYYWSLIYDYWIILTTGVLVHRSEEHGCDLWATLFSCQGSEDWNQQAALTVSKYLEETQNSVAGQKTCQNSWWIFQALYVWHGAIIQNFFYQEVKSVFPQRSKSIFSNKNRFFTV